VVSEERGEVTIMCDGHVERAEGTDRIRESVTRFATPAAGASPQWPFPPVSEWRITAAAVLLAAAAWTVTFIVPGQAVREQTIPVELLNVPAGLVITSQSAATIEVWLRGSDIVFASVNLADLIADCDLSVAHLGTNRIPVQFDPARIPPGLTLAAIAPRELTIRLEASPR
jgi:hypothetical protein